MKPLRFPAGLYGVTPDWADTARLLTAVRHAAEGGMRSLQLRRKNATADERAAQARALVPLCRELGVVLMINDDWRLALEVGADGAHLGRDDDALAGVRREVGPDLLLGVSCYNDLDRARDLLAQGADYIAFGAVFASSTKPQAVQAPLSLLTEAAALADTCPAPRPAVVAIGGITAQNAPLVAQAGADAIAVITGLFEMPDIRAAARACAAACASVQRGAPARPQP
ncbi:thiamine phosphate synthase [Bordetella genomosp. 5]|uniref:Thiamine-phosphate synthase n=1 Tax=Bordetella genomosp. 5 TaxID=1395608 RepID=A0A261U2M4_9BORD|nr:thiamine phosphate synthase [Bordetella genomosp. 5]OZI47568.1 thiamine phosphate synthase [Bordetella genomosp. 5]OZI55500.1 thiamine-phosphate diphosphorylase [Bordetella genomosp. 5]